jgi:hypothetical protein
MSGRRRKDVPPPRPSTSRPSVPPRDATRLVHTTAPIRSVAHAVHEEMLALISMPPPPLGEYER